MSEVKADTKKKLISGAWPDDLAIREKCRIHAIVSSLNMPIKKEDLVYRRMAREDMRDFKDYEAEWFPFVYPDSFYDQALTSKDEFAVGCFWRPPSQSAEYLLGGVMARYESNQVALQFATKALGLPVAESGCCFPLTQWLCGSERSNLYITSIGVADEARRLGVCTALLREVEKSARSDRPKCVCISLHVLETNKAARGCYEKNGFQFASLIKGYYTMFGKRHNGLYYVKPLPRGEEGEAMVGRQLPLLKN